MKRIIVLVLTWLAVVSAHASHNFMDGMEVTYIHKGSGVYDVYYTRYRRCERIPGSLLNVTAKSSQHTLISSSTLVSLQDVTAEGFGCELTDLDTACASVQLNDRIQKITAKATFDLGQYTGVCEWQFFVLESEARDASTGTYGMDYWNYALLNRCHGDFSSPQFQRSAQLSLPRNNDIYWDASVSDTLSSSDSISYELTDALVGPGQTVTYILMPINARSPLNYLGFPTWSFPLPAGFHLNQQGMVRFRPTLANQKATIVVEVKKWTRIQGTMTLIGIVRRDIEVTVLNAPSNPTKPTIKLSDGSALPSKVFLRKDEVGTLDLKAVDQDTLQSPRITVSILPDFADTTLVRLPGYDSLNIQLSPDQSALKGTVPDTIRLTVDDDICPVNKSRTHTIWVYVYDDPLLYVSADSAECENWVIRKDSTVNVKSYPGHPFLSRWTIIDSLGDTLQLDDPILDMVTLGAGPYWVFVDYGYEGGMQYRDSIYLPEIDLKIAYTVNSTDTICNTDTGIFALDLQGNTSTYSVIWSSLQTGNQLLIPSDSVLLVNNLGVQSDSRYLLQIEENNGCYFYSDTLDLSVKTRLPIQLIDSIAECEEVGVSLVVNLYDPAYDFWWNTGQTGDSIFVQQSGSFIVSVQDKGAFCPVVRDTAVVIIHPTPRIDVMNDTAICLGESVSARPLNNEVYDYFWNGASGSQDFVPQQSGNFNLEVFSAKGCHFTDSFFVALSTVPTFHTLPANPGVCGGEEITMSLSTSVNAGGFTYVWSLGSDSSTAVMPAGIFVVRVYDSIGCQAMDSFEVIQKPLPNAGFTTSQWGNTINFIPAEIPGSHEWVFGDGSPNSNATSPSHAYAQAGTYQIRHQLTNADGCTADTVEVISISTGLTSELNAQIKVWPNPTPGNIQVQFPSWFEKESITVALIGVDGKIIRLYQGKAGRDLNLQFAEKLPAGNYRLRIQSDKSLIHVPLQLIR